MNEDPELGWIHQAGEEGSAVLGRGLAILHLLSKRSGQSVKDLSAGSGIPLATTYRIVRQLIASGFVTDQDGVIHAGSRMSSDVEQGTGHLVTAARPILRALTAATGVASILTVRVHTLALCLDTMRVAGGQGPAFRVGETQPLYASASAAPLLAYSSPELVEQVLHYPIRPFTARTPDATMLKERLQQIRADGYYFSRGEMQPQWTGLGVPVLEGNQPMCCLSLAAPGRDLRATPKFLEPLKQAAHDLSRRISDSSRPITWTPTLRADAPEPQEEQST